MALGQEYELFPWLTPEQVEAAQEAAAQVTNIESDDIVGRIFTDQSYEVVGAADFPADPVLSPFDGSGFSIAILDTGANFNHPALANRVVYDQDFVNGDMDASDDNGHGTAVASIAAGLAPGVDLIILKVADSSGFVRLQAVKDALLWVRNNMVGHDIAAVNMSFGDANWTSVPVPERYHYTTDVTATIQAGVAVVAGGGNSYKT